MGISLLFESMTTAASVGMGCGTCCGSGISALLYGYLVTHAKNIKQSVRAFLEFFLGKLIAVAVICVLASLLGQSVLDEDGRILGFPISLAVNTVMIIMGIRLIIRWFRDRYGNNKCRSCGHCSGRDQDFSKEKNPSHGLLLGMGFGYGISPCAPLVLMAGYAATLPAGYAAILGGVFAAASTISPALLLLLLTGVLAGKMQKEIPVFLTWFRLACYIILVLIFTISFVKEFCGVF